MASRVRSKTKPDVQALMPMLMARQDGKCAICRKKIGGTASLGRTTPIAKGGSDKLDNLLALHPMCAFFKFRFQEKPRKALCAFADKGRKRYKKNKCVLCGKEKTKGDVYLLTCKQCR